MTQTGHKYFKTRVTKGIDTKTMHEVYFPQVSTERGRWSYVIKEDAVLYFQSKHDADHAVRTMVDKNNIMLDAAAKKDQPHD